MNKDKFFYRFGVVSVWVLASLLLLSSVMSFLAYSEASHANSRVDRVEFFLQQMAGRQ